jgi:hypothetical protein
VELRAAPFPWQLEPSLWEVEEAKRKKRAAAAKDRARENQPKL